MALIVDEDFLVQSLRLTFLRHLPLDRAGAALITFDDVRGRARSRHVVAAGLDNEETWPELVQADAADAVDLGDLPEPGPSRPLGSTSLRHTETIGGHGASAGMRVSGRKRLWAGRRERERTTDTVRAGDGKGKGRESENATPVDGDTPRAPSIRRRLPSIRIGLRSRRQSGDELDSPTVDSPTVDSPTARGKTDESDTDRGESNGPRVTIRSPHLDESPMPPEDSGEAESTPEATQSYLNGGSLHRDQPVASSYTHDQEVSDALRWGTDAAAARRDQGRTRANGGSSDGGSVSGTSLQPRTQTTDNEWSMLDQSAIRGRSSTSDETGFTPLSPSQSEPAAPITEAVEADEELADSTQPLVGGRRRERRRVNISGRTAMAMPPIKEDEPSGQSGRARARTLPTTAEHIENRSRSGSDSATGPAEPRRGLGRKSSAPQLAPDKDPAPPLRPDPPPPAPSLTFQRTPIRPAPASTSSALTAMLSAASRSSGPTNPFTHLYGALAARQSEGLALSAFFPSSSEPLKAVTFRIRRDVSVEEVIGAALREYFEQGREPRLEKGIAEWDGEALVGKLDPARWNLMAAEDDGEVDDDFPLDRSQPITKVGSTFFGIVEASGSQIAANTAHQASIVRRPSRIIAGPPKTLSPARIVPSLSSTTVGALSIVDGAGTIQNTPSPVAAGEEVPQVLLRVRIPMLDSGPLTSTVKVASNMYLADVLELICRKRKEPHLANPKDWVLMVADKDMVVPLDRTVEGLQGVHQLRLARKADVTDLRESNPPVGTPSNTNPSASIFKRLSEVPQPKYITAADVTSSYREFTVYRKHAMSLSRHERILVIDGDYVQIRSSESGRAGSYHISSIVEAKQSKRVPTSFKLTVWLDNREMKRQDYEAQSARDATDIVSRIKALAAAHRATVDRAG